MFVSTQGYARSLCIKMTFVSGAVLDFGMVRSKGNVRFGNVARVPALVLTLSPQEPRVSLPSAADPACDEVRTAGIELPVWLKVRPATKLGNGTGLELLMLSARSCSLWC